MCKYLLKKEKISLKIKLISALDERDFEGKVNNFLEENKEKIEVVEIQWRCFIAHHAMIIFKEI